MARLASIGFELNSLATDVELSSATGSALSISSTSPISGNYSLKVNPTDASAFNATHYFSTIGIGNIVYYRINIKVASYPTSAIKLLGVFDTIDNLMGSIVLNESGVLIMFAADDVTQLGNTATAVPLNATCTVELKIDATNLNLLAYQAQFNTVQFSNATFDTSALGLQGQSYVWIVDYHTGATNTFTMWIDDLAINDTTGSAQNSWAGYGKIIHLNPDASGDSNTFATQTGGTAGSANNYTRVNEVMPDDATTFNGSNTLNQEDLFNCAPSGIGASDIVNVVQVGGRFANNIADAATAIKFEVEKIASGTISQSAAIIPNTITYNTNTTATPHTYPLILSKDPDNGNWTKTTLDTMQIGYKITAGGTNRIQVSTIWALVDYTPIAPQVYVVGNRASQPINKMNIIMF